MPKFSLSARAVALALAVAVVHVECALRQYYVAAVEDVWDFGPTGMDRTHNISLDDGEVSAIFCRNGDDRIGRRYHKARYAEYTDATFTEEKPRPEEWKHLGVLGPLLRVEVGDTLEITFRNLASRPFSIHTHGLRYDKVSEGAWYADGTSPAPGDSVEPGSTATYTLQAVSKVGPGPYDLSSGVALYYSHVDEVRDVYSGLVGAIIITSSGYARGPEDLVPIDVDREFVTYYSIFDENESWYLDENMQDFIPNYDNNTAEELKHDADFHESNLMHSVNGFVYSNLPNPTMVSGERVRWYLLTLGSKLDLHTAHWHGEKVFHPLLHHTDVVMLQAGSTQTADMKPNSEGTWMVHCHVNDHIEAGMVFLMTVLPCNETAVAAAGLTRRSGAECPNPTLVTGTNHTYYLGIVEEEWDYAPSGRNPLLNISLEEDPHAGKWCVAGHDRIGRTYKKARYLEYTDLDFSTVVPRPPEWEHLGLTGPILRAEVGDLINVVVRNTASRPYTLHVHGLHYEKPSEGAPYYYSKPPGDRIDPGETVGYTYFVPEEAGPQEDDPSSLVWVYHSHVDEPKDTSSGLIGAILVTRKGSATGTVGGAGDRDGLRPNDIDREFVLVFTAHNENSAWYIDDNIEHFLPWLNATEADALKEDSDFQDSNIMHNINGFVFGNVPGLLMTESERVRWYVIGMGNEIDLHSVTWHSEKVIYKGRATDAIQLMPATMTSVDMLPTHPGTWEFHCHMNDHNDAGMVALMTVQCNSTSSDCSVPQPPTSSPLRTYYLAAIEIEWDYAPSGKNLITGAALADDPDTAKYTVNSEDRIGPKYKKVVYREYADSGFSKEKQRTSEWDHLGVLGPILRAEVGDTVKIVFRNMASREYSFDVHGLVDLASRGDTSKDDKRQQPVAPGEETTYTFLVPASAGPQTLDGSSVVWQYHSHVDDTQDTNTGLIGGLIVTNAGGSKLDEEGNLAGPKDIDREVMLLFTTFDENESWYEDENMHTYLPDLDDEQRAQLLEDEDFLESNRKHSINGFLFGNLPTIELTEGQRVRWYLLALGGSQDMHSVYWHGEVLNHRGAMIDVVRLLPGSGEVADMTADNTGTWMLHCHTTDHLSAGMTGLFTISPAEDEGSKGLPPWAIGIISGSGALVLLIGGYVLYRKLNPRRDYIDIDDDKV